MSFFSAHDPSIIPAAPWLHPLQRFSIGLYRGLFGLAKAMTVSWERPLQDLRADIGLPQTKKRAMFEGQFSPRLTLALFSRRLAEPQPDWPANTEICGFMRYDGGSMDGAVEAGLKSFLDAGEPPIVFTLGSSVSMDPKDFFNIANQAAKELGQRAILISGSPPTAHSSRPETVKEFSYLPYSRVFPHASVNVHPGGIGTMSQALAAGRPMLVTPVAFDQPDNAHRASRLGVARVLPFRKVTAASLMEQIRPILYDRDCQDRAANVGRQVRSENGVQRACDLIEKIAPGF
jgi:UDP:flavonoid glycosyltransferase YjiC (YdhE family)